jgi:hypothetical protein
LLQHADLAAAHLGSLIEHCAPHPGANASLLMELLRRPLQARLADGPVAAARRWLAAALVAPDTLGACTDAAVAEIAALLLQQADVRADGIPRLVRRWACRPNNAALLTTLLTGTLRAAARHHGRAARPGDSAGGAGGARELHRRAALRAPVFAR